MRKIAIFLLAAVVLLTSAVAEVSKDRLRIVSGDYTADSDQLEFVLNLAIDKSPAGILVGHVGTFIVDTRQGAFRVLSAYGIVPLSALKVTGSSIAVNIRNLRDLVGPDFSLQETGFPGPIPLNCTIAKALDLKTSFWKTAYSTVRTQRIPQPDGNVTVEKSTQSFTSFSGTAEGVLADFLIPVADAQYDGAGFGKSSGVSPELSDTLVMEAVAAEKPDARKSGERLVHGSYALQGQVNFHIVLNLIRAVNGRFEGEGEFSIVDWGSRGTFRGLSASGKFPASALRVTGRSISVNISDLRNLVGPDFQLHETGIPGPIPVNCTITQTDSSETAYRAVSVYRDLRPDGTVRTYTRKQSYWYASGSGSGSIADYEIPWLPDPLPDGSYTSASFGASKTFTMLK